MSPRNSAIDDYIWWLRRRVDGLSPSLDIFFETLWRIEYVYDHADDKNRSEDGLILRKHWAVQTTPGVQIMGNCTVLEFLIALAERLNDALYDYENPDQVASWFWLLIENLGIQNTDTECLKTLGTGEIEDVLAKFMNREYAPDGSEGGLFPLMHANNDQRVIGVWYQMQNYLMENW